MGSMGSRRAHSKFPPKNHRNSERGAGWGTILKYNLTLVRPSIESSRFGRFFEGDQSGGGWAPYLDIKCDPAEDAGSAMTAEE